MTPPFDTVTILGVGLLGGSLGLAVKARGLAHTVRGVGHRKTSLDKAIDVGAIDEAHFDAAQAAAGADLIVLCTPAALIPAQLDAILPVCSERTVITDVASTKAAICAHAQNTCPKPRRFVGSHPMAGSEKFGPENAEPHLYEGAIVMMERSDDLDPQAVAAVKHLWEAVGATVVQTEPGLHDALVARTSHVPHLLAACLARLVARQKEARPFIGNGFRDVTRIAASRPSVWRDICLTNRDAVLAGIDAFATELADIRQTIAQSDSDALIAFFESAGRARQEMVDP